MHEVVHASCAHACDCMCERAHKIIQALADFGRECFVELLWADAIQCRLVTFRIR